MPFADEQLGNEARPFVLVNGRILARPAAGAFLKQQHAPAAEQPARQQPSSRGASKRRKREKTPSTTSHRKRTSPGGNGGQFVAAATVDAGTTAAPSGSVSHGGIATSDRSGGGTGAGTGSGTPRGAPPSSPRNRKEHHGRWSTDRYEAAQRSLIHILRLMGATSPDVSILRPTLREEARKVIGDTGLLDHLLKHLADQVVSPEGERLRRRHNREGHMEYWLQNPAAMEEEEKMMQNELTALTSELREVREARHALQTVRTEAAQAIQAVSGLKEHPTEAAAGLVGMQTPVELAARMDAVELANVNLQRRLYDAESLAASGIEELRKELSEAGHVLGEHIGTFQKATEELTQRCRELEFKSAVASEDAAGRFEAVSAALTQAVGVTNMFRQEMAQRDVILGYLQREMAGLRQALATVAMAGAPPAVTSPQQAQQQQQQQQMSPVVTSTTTTSQTPLPSQPAQVAAARPSLPVQQQQQQPFSAVPAPFAAQPATTTPAGAAGAGDKDGLAAGAAVPGSNYQPLTPLKPSGSGLSAGGPAAAATPVPSAALDGGGGDAATAPVAGTTSPPVQSTNDVKDEEMPLQMSRQALEPATITLAAHEGGNSPKLASTTAQKEFAPPL